MRVLFTTMPYPGGLRLFVPLAHAVRRAGHQVAVAAPGWFAPVIRRHGLEPVSAGIGDTPEQLESMFASIPADPADAFWWVFTNWVGGAHCRRMAEDLISQAPRWKPDLIVRESTEFGGCLAAEVLGIPHAVVYPRPAPSRLSYRLRAGLNPVLERRRRELGLRPDPEARMPSRYLELAFLPACFFGGEDAFSERTHFVNFGLVGLEPDDASSVAAEPARAGALSRVYISLGTLWYEAPGVMETIVTALSAEPLELIVFPGDERAAERLRSVVAAMPPHPARVMIDPSVAQLAALRRSDVFVTHSGMNSVRESLILGVPMIGVPIRGDQMFNAARCEAVGVGRCVPAHELRAELVGDAVRSVRDVPAYRAASARLRDSVAALPPIARAVYLLEELVQTGRPITRPGDRHRRA